MPVSACFPLLWEAQLARRLHLFHHLPAPTLAIKPPSRPNSTAVFTVMAPSTRHLLPGRL